MDFSSCLALSIVIKLKASSFFVNKAA